jgi:protein-tyrosine kinase
MSHLFNALQKSEAERSGNGKRWLTASELLQSMERETAAQQEILVASAEGEDPVNPPDFLVGAETELSAPAGDVPNSLQLKTELEVVRLPPPELPMEGKQRDELMKFIQQMFLMPRAPRAVVLTGIEPGDGCSWICCRAAYLLATQVKGAVCIVDANMRSPALHQIYGVENRSGLSDALESTQPMKDFLRPVGRPNLWLLSCGADVGDRNPLLNVDRVRARIAELRRYFDYVMIDSPALNLGSDTVVLGRAAEAAVLILKANSTRREAARKAVQDLQNAGVRVWGAVLNQRKFPIPESVYSKL